MVVWQQKNGQEAYLELRKRLICWPVFFKLLNIEAIELCVPFRGGRGSMHLG